MRPLVQLAAYSLAVGFAAAAILLCGLTLLDGDRPAGPPIVIPTTYGPPR